MCHQCTGMLITLPLAKDQSTYVMTNDILAKPRYDLDLLLAPKTIVDHLLLFTMESSAHLKI